MMRDALAGAAELVFPEATLETVGDYPSAWAAMSRGFDLCISDLVMPGAQPLDGMQRLRKAAPATPILVVTGDEEDAHLLALFDMGVAGFVPKTSKSAVVEAAIGVVAAGERYIPARVLDLLGRRNDVHPIVADKAAKLSPRQTEVLQLIVQGQSNKQIARVLGLAPTTVKAHLAVVMLVLGAANRTEAVARARASGLV
jgi:DNA-binding NarL/FixJ family response regulator